jgi:MFS family permease
MKPGSAAIAGILLGANLLNYLDRQLFLSLFPLFKGRFHLSDLWLGVLASSFTAVYVIVAPLAGYLIRKFPIGRLLGGGIAIFSLGMAISALSRDTVALFIGRMMTGAGEAALTTLGPLAVLGKDAAHPGRRLGFFFAAIPVGSALGFGAGAILPRLMDFQTALLVPVLPGIVAGILLWGLRIEGGRGEEGHRFFRLSSSDVSAVPWGRIGLSFFFQTAYTFVLGGMAAWISVYLTRVKAFDLSLANALTGGSLVLGGATGMLLGGAILDRERKRDRESWGRLATASGFGVAAAGIIAVLLAKGDVPVALGLTAASFGLFLTIVPTNWMILSAGVPVLTAPLLGWSLLISHLFGDLPSPTLIGWASQGFGLNVSLAVILLSPVISAIVIAAFCRPGWVSSRTL